MVYQIYFAPHKQKADLFIQLKEMFQQNNFYFLVYLKNGTPTLPDHKPLLSKAADLYILNETTHHSEKLLSNTLSMPMPPPQNQKLNLSSEICTAVTAPLQDNKRKNKVLVKEKSCHSTRILPANQEEASTRSKLTFPISSWPERFLLKRERERTERKLLDRRFRSSVVTTLLSPKASNIHSSCTDMPFQYLFDHFLIFQPLPLCCSTRNS